MIRPAKFKKKVSVKQKTVDSFFRDLGRSPTVIKVEAEGHEPEILRGATNTLAECGPVLLIDAGPERRGQSTIKMCKEILIKFDYNFEILPDGKRMMAFPISYKYRA